MSKANQAPIRVIVEGGRLTPASAYDQEQLQQYQNGAVLEITLWQGRNQKLLRKFFAILGKVVDDCPTPWKTKDQAADALKMACGITDYGKSVNGQFFIRPGSISFANMDEAKFQKFFDLAIAVLHKLTGVDPLTLGKEADDTGPEPNNLKVPELKNEAPATRYFWHPESSSLFMTTDGSDGREGDPLCEEIDQARYDEIRVFLATDEEEEETTEQALGIASQFAAEVAEQAAAESADPVAPEEREPPPPQTDSSEAEGFTPLNDQRWIQGVTKMLIAATNPGGDVQVLVNQKTAARHGYPSAGISPETKAKANLIFNTCKEIVEAGDFGKNDERIKYLEGLTGLKLEKKDFGAERK